MALKNALKIKRAQSTVEYLLLFTLLSIICLFALLRPSGAFSRFRQEAEHYFERAMQAMR
jgi:hypothetical protein